jgi:Fe-S cluster assembly protein SufB
MSALPSAAALAAWSRTREEPAWLRDRRLSALSRAAAGGGRGVLGEEAPLRAPLRAPELEAQGVRVRTLRQALKEDAPVVERFLPPLPEDASAEAAAHEALWSDGYFVHAPAGVKAALAVQLGSDLARAAQERTLIVVEDSASLTLVEGCAGGSGAAPERASVLDAFVGAAASLSGASVQAWPPEVRYRSLKRVTAGAGARVEWLDGNLGARSADKRLLFRLAPDASVRATVAGFAGPGQTLRLEALAEGDGASAALESRAAACGGRLRAYLLAGGGVRVSRAEAELDLERLSDEELFYLETRGLRGAAAREAAAHAFFEPFARRLPLEFSVEFTRLLDAELSILD